MSAAVGKGKQTTHKLQDDARPEPTALADPGKTAARSSQSRTVVLETKKLVQVEPQDTLTTKFGLRIQVDSLIFDVDWYRAEYPDVAAASLDPVRHYFDNGFREGRNPNRYFDTNWYASSNPDVAAAGLNPFLHYLLYGAREGRKPAP